MGRRRRSSSKSTSRPGKRPAVIGMREEADGRRERAPKWLELCLDAMAYERAGDRPLSRALERAMSRGRPPSRTRRAAGDALFGWARRRAPAQAEIERLIAEVGGIRPGKRVLDTVALALTLRWQGRDLLAHQAERVAGLPWSALLDEVPAPDAASLLPPWLRRAPARARRRRTPARLPWARRAGGLGRRSVNGGPGRDRRGPR